MGTPLSLAGHVAGQPKSLQWMHPASTSFGSLTARPHAVKSPIRWALPISVVFYLPYHEPNFALIGVHTGRAIFHDVGMCPMPWAYKMKPHAPTAIPEPCFVSLSP